jgi:hypothetical protein
MSDGFGDLALIARHCMLLSWVLPRHEQLLHKLICAFRNHSRRGPNLQSAYFQNLSSMFRSRRPLPQQGRILLSRLETTEDILKSCSLLRNWGWSEILIRYHAHWLGDRITRHHDLRGRKRARMTGGGGDISGRGSWRGTSENCLGERRSRKIV